MNPVRLEFQNVQATRCFRHRGFLRDWPIHSEAIRRPRAYRLWLCTAGLRELDTDSCQRPIWGSTRQLNTPSKGCRRVWTVRPDSFGVRVVQWFLGEPSYTRTNHELNAPKAARLLTAYDTERRAAASSVANHVNTAPAPRLVADATAEHLLSGRTT